MRLPCENESPIGYQNDRMAICEGLANGTIDAIATDHAPHSNEEKAMGLASSFDGWQLKGRPVLTMFDGRISFEESIN